LEKQEHKNAKDELNKLEKDARKNAIKMPKRTGGGLIEMGDDRIELAHQLQERDRQQRSCLQSVKKMKALQAAFQRLRMDPTIKSVQADAEKKGRKFEEGPVAQGRE
jgi:chaperonin cofactor prefoldin